MKNRYFRYQALFKGIYEGKYKWHMEEGYIRAWTKKQAKREFEKNINKYDLEHLIEIAFEYEKQ